MVAENIARGDTVRIKARNSGATVQTDLTVLGRVINICVSGTSWAVTVQWRDGTTTTEFAYDLDNLDFRVARPGRGPTPVGSSESSSSSSKSSVSSSSSSSSQSSSSSSKSSVSSVSSSKSSESSGSSQSSSRSSASSSRSSNSSASSYSSRSSKSP